MWASSPSCWKRTWRELRREDTSRFFASYQPVLTGTPTTPITSWRNLYWGYLCVIPPCTQGMAFVAKLAASCETRGFIGSIAGPGSFAFMDDYFLGLKGQGERCVCVWGGFNFIMLLVDDRLLHWLKCDELSKNNSSLYPAVCWGEICTWQLIELSICSSKL